MTEHPIDLPEHARDVASATRSRVITWSVVVALILLSLAANFLETSLGLRETIVPAWLRSFARGICVGQLYLIAVWAALAPTNVVVRTSWAFFLATLMWYASLLGGRESLFISSSSKIARPQAIVMIITLVTSIVLLQIPLWIARKKYHWRLVRQQDHDDATAIAESQYQIRHLLAAMLLLSAVLTPLYLVLPSSSGYEVWYFSLRLFLGKPLMLLANYILLIPCFILAYKVKSRWIPLAFAVLLPYSVVVTLAEVPAYYVISVVSDHVSFEPPSLASCLCKLAQYATVLGGLLVLRALGYRLGRARSDQPTSRKSGKDHLS